MESRAETNDDAIAQVFKRNDFYRNHYLLALGAFFLSLIVVFVLIGVLLFLKRNPTQPLYFATDNVGRLVPVVSLETPNMTEEEVEAWVVEAVQHTYSYDYVNYRKQLQNAQKYYTSYGWSNYLAALTASNNLVALKERKMIVLARVIDKPRIINQGLLGSAYAWKFEMPVLVSYWLPPYDEQSKFSNPLLVTVILQRQSILQSYKGLGIVQVIGSVAAADANQAPQEITNPPSG